MLCGHNFKTIPPCILCIHWTHCMDDTLQISSSSPKSIQILCKTMRLSITFACCLASKLLTSNCLAIDSTHPVDPFLRGREKDESAAGRSGGWGRRVRQVYFEQRADMDEIEVPSESIPLPILTSREDGQRELSFWSSILSELNCFFASARFCFMYSIF